MKKLFRNVLAFYATIAIPLVYVLGLWCVAQGNTQTFVPIFRIICLSLALIGIVIWIGSYISLGKYFGVLPEKHAKTKQGLYAYMDHPMYYGIMLTYLGLSVTNQSKLGVEYTIFLLGPLLYIRAKLEEKKLENPDTISLKK